MGQKLESYQSLPKKAGNEHVRIRRMVLLNVHAFRGPLHHFEEADP